MYVTKGAQSNLIHCRRLLSTTIKLEARRNYYISSCNAAAQVAIILPKILLKKTSFPFIFKGCPNNSKNYHDDLWIQAWPMQVYTVASTFHSGRLTFFMIRTPGMLDFCEIREIQEYEKGTQETYQGEKE